MLGSIGYAILLIIISHSEIMLSVFRDLVPWRGFPFIRLLIGQLEYIRYKQLLSRLTRVDLVELDCIF